MAEQHPITPPPELVRKWAKECSPYDVPADHIAAQAAHWGADQELEACCADIHVVYGQQRADWLREMRRPKPPSLAEKALDTLKTKKLLCFDHPEGYNIIHCALERLQELENNG